MFNKNWFTTLLDNYANHGITFRLTFYRSFYVTTLHLLISPYALTHKYDAHDMF